MNAPIYLKTGRTIRVEMVRGTLTRLTQDSSGYAKEETAFICGTRATGLDPPPLPEFDVNAAVEEIRSFPGVERFTLLSGAAAHQITREEATVEWTETFGRLHLSLVSMAARIRVAVHVGAESLTNSHLGVARNAAEGLARASVRGPGSRVPGPLLLRPAVAAALWTEVALARIPCGLEQSTHEHFQRDGDGLVIQPLPLDSAPGWPNRFRPSYRSRPVPMPFHVRAGERGSRPEAASRALAVVTPFHIINGYIAGRVLCEDTVRSIELPLRELNSRVLSVSGRMEWFPYGAGAYGSEVVIDI